MASEAPIIVETRSLSVRQVSNGYVMSGSILTSTITPPSTQAFVTQATVEVIADTAAEVVAAVSTFLDGGPL
jgi:hypothetical protein